MLPDEKAKLIQEQKEERSQILKNILDSKAPKKLIVAGAGTGKTFTFSQVLQQMNGGKNIAMTFIRLLRDDMSVELGDYAEVRTFHEFCKKILHEHRGGFILFPKLTDVIRSDADYLEESVVDIDKKFQTLDEKDPGIGFYLRRGDYYNAVSFNDSVYRMLNELRKDPALVGQFDQILIDEFQDFNPLEVAFIGELEKCGNILIVGDDDQAVYDSRYSSAHHLREKHGSGEYEVFELPFCTRCPEVIVKGVNGILETAEACEGLQGRIHKRYECFIEAKDQDNLLYPKIVTAQLVNIPLLNKYIRTQIDMISEEEIKQSWIESKEYPTVLIVGAKQYLNAAYKELQKHFKNVKYKQSVNTELSIADGYQLLLEDDQSNLGWRIIIEFLLDPEEIERILITSVKGAKMTELISGEFRKEQEAVLGLLHQIKDNCKNDDGEANVKPIKDLESALDPDVVSDLLNRICGSKEEEPEVDKSQPSILLTSYQGCKGLSAGFVFIVGANNGVMPRNPTATSDAEICQFIVAMTRTRKKCYVLSDKWDYGVKDKDNQWIEPRESSLLTSLIPKELVEDQGYLKKASMFTKVD